MATWRFIGTINPSSQFRFFDTLSLESFYRILIPNPPERTDSFLVLEAWANQRRIGQIVRPVQPEQVFHWLKPCERMISLRMGRPLRSPGDLEQIQVGLYEWVDQPSKPDPELNLWLPGNP